MSTPPASLSSEPRVLGARWLDIFSLFLRLGLTSFGGPIAHLGYFRGEFVERRGWLSEEAYADLVALCQFLPGPASSQVGASIGYLRGGVGGLIAAWLGFTLPSAILLMLFALGLTHLHGALGAGCLHGLKLVAVAVVAQALWGMGKTLCPDRARATMAVAAALLVSLLPSSSGQIVAMVLGALGGAVMLKKDRSAAMPAPSTRQPRRLGLVALAIYAALLLGLPLVARSSDIGRLFERFYRAGALVFGGGHVVLPLLQAAVVPTGMISNDAFLAGYGAAQAMPGPLFTLAAYLGFAASSPPNGIVGALVALVGIFLPGLLLIVAALPYWQSLRSSQLLQAAMKGVNAAVVGILLAAFYQPVFSGSVVRSVDFGAALLAFLLLAFWRWPSWLVVATGAGLGWMLQT